MPVTLHSFFFTDYLVCDSAWGVLGDSEGENHRLGQHVVSGTGNMYLAHYHGDLESGALIRTVDVCRTDSRNWGWP